MVLVRFVFDGLKCAGRRDNRTNTCGVKVDPRNVTYEELTQRMAATIVNYTGFGMTGSETEPQGADPRQLYVQDLVYESRMGGIKHFPINNDEDLTRILSGLRMPYMKVLVNVKVRDAEEIEGEPKRKY
eukprot:TRINITY_DN572_c0_g1_i1.p1 TRINITY_DN572_c0_g1~~TRINITY_DN572_c0_g1_i1.p1  ORF type:complete len:129 (-),score=29.29 TRINITY_DN572_c0_g1_i1:40-426(-)